MTKAALYHNRDASHCRATIKHKNILDADKAYSSHPMVDTAVSSLATRQGLMATGSPHYLHGVAVGVGGDNKREQVCQRFTRSCMCVDDDVTIFRQKSSDRRYLDLSVHIANTV